MTATINQSFSVQYNYSVLFPRNVFAPENKTFASVFIDEETPCKILFIVEDSVAAFYPDLLDQIVSYGNRYSDFLSHISPPIVISGGEQSKSLGFVESVCTKIAEHKLCRHSYVAIIGGGAFLDSVGFAASIVHRGIRQLRFPTTAVSQGDSGVGVKNGINMFGQKNFIGSFAPPFAVINDFSFLDSLADRDWRAGIAEAIKVAIIKDKTFFYWICSNIEDVKNRKAEAVECLITTSAKIHSDHISGGGDPFEFGSARPLDFGHWSAHKIEMLTRGGVRHGEAVAIGIMLDSYYANEKRFISDQEFSEIERLFLDLGFNLWDDCLFERTENNRHAILTGLSEFREHLGGKLHITLPNRIGSKLEVFELDEIIVANGINYLYENHAIQSPVLQP